MLDKGRISSVQLLFLLLMSEIATSLLYAPAATGKVAGPDAWITILFPTTAYGLIVAFVCVFLAKRFPFDVFTEYLPKVIGRIPGKVLGIVYIGIFVHLTSVMVVEGSQFVQTNFLIETPLLVLQLVLVSIAAYGAYLGIEVIARHNEIVFPFFIFSLGLLIILVAKDIRISNIFPVLEHGFMPILKASLVPSAWRGEVFIILMLFPYLNQKDEGMKTAVGMVLIGAILAGLMAFTVVGVFGDLYASRLTYAVNALARYISVGGILERMELVIVIIWVAGVIVKIAVFYHASSIAAATTLGIKNYKIFIIPVALVTIIIGNHFFGTYIQLSNFIIKIFPFYGYVIELIIPSIVLLIAMLLKKRVNTHG